MVASVIVKEWIGANELSVPWVSGTTTTTNVEADDDQCQLASSCGVHPRAPSIGSTHRGA